MSELVYMLIQTYFRARSSVGSEHLVYTQGVRGSNPFAPTFLTSTLVGVFLWKRFYKGNYKCWK